MAAVAAASRRWCWPATTIRWCRLINARILAGLIPRARLEVVDDGHLFLLSNPRGVAPSIRRFLAGTA